MFCAVNHQTFYDETRKTIVTLPVYQILQSVFLQSKACSNLNYLRGDYASILYIEGY